jgi:hypothetical protein
MSDTFPSHPVLIKTSQVSPIILHCNIACQVGGSESFARGSYASRTRNGLSPHQPVCRDLAVQGPKWICTSVNQPESRFSALPLATAVRVVCILLVLLLAWCERAAESVRLYV